MNFVNFLVLLSSVFQLLFSCHLFFVKKGNRFLNRLLAFFFISRFFDNLVYVLIFSGLLIHFPFLLNLFISISFAGPACFFLYINAFLKDQYKFKKSDFLHFIPFLLLLIFGVIWFFYNTNESSTIAQNIVSNKSFIYSERFGLFTGKETIFLRQFFYLFYFVFIGKSIYHTGIIQRRDWKPIENRWIVFVAVSFFLLQINRFAIAFFANEGTPANLLFLNISGGFIALLTIGIILFLIFNPKVLYGFIFITKDSLFRTVDSLSLGTNPQIVSAQRKPKYFNAEQKQLHIAAILKFMSDDKPFLYPDFRIVHIAEHLEIPVHHCSYILNYELNKNFRDWINGYRTQYFIEQFMSKSDRMTIEAMAAESGFSTSATFYNAFKKEKGVSPTTFFKKITN
jgi:AraC-like DNA-binding protein